MLRFRRYHMTCRRFETSLIVPRFSCDMRDHFAFELSHCRSVIYFATIIVAYRRCQLHGEEQQTCRARTPAIRGVYFTSSVACSTIGSGYNVLIGIIFVPVRSLPACGHPCLIHVVVAHLGVLLAANFELTAS